MTSAIHPDEVTKYERETWSRCANSYVETFGQFTAQTVPLLIDGAQIAAGGRVLEVGSGPGHVCAAVAEKGAEATGIDFSGDMVDLAKRLYPDVQFRQANAEELPFEDESFDAVVSNFVVHHLARPAVVFKEIARVLEPGGRFAFVVWGTPEAQSSVGAFFAAVMAHHDLGELPHGPLFGVTERDVYEPLIAEGGLSDLRLETHKVEWRSSSLESILQGFWDWGNVAALPRVVQDKIEATTRENSKPYVRDEGYAFPHEVLLGVAEKRSRA